MLASCLAVAGFFIRRHVRDREYGNAYLLNDSICQVWDSDGNTYLADPYTGKRLSERYSWISDVSDGDSLAVFCDLKDRRGYINVNTGREIIKGCFAHAWVFSEGLAAVADENGKLGFIDPEGNYVIQPGFDYSQYDDYVFHKGFCWIQDEEGLSGAIDKTGKWVLEPQFSLVDDYADNAFILKKDGYYGLMGLDLTWLLPPEYDGMYICSETDSTVFVRKDNVKSLVSYTGSVIEPFVFDSIVTMTYDAVDKDEELNAPYLRIGVGSKYGVLSATGKVILPPVFDYVEMASASLFACIVDEDNYEQVLYDIQGRPLGETISRQVR